MSWNTTTAQNGTHSLTAVARDVAGTTTTSAARSVTVANWAAPSGLVAAYTFEAGTGTTVADASGRGRTGTRTSGASWTTAGRFGGGLSFKGSNGLVSVADAASLDFTSAMTIEAWVRPTARSNWDTVVMKATAAPVVPTRSMPATTTAGPRRRSASIHRSVRRQAQRRCP